MKAFKKLFMKKFFQSSILVFLIVISNNVFSQNIYRWYQDGIVVFQLKTDTDYQIPSKDKVVNFEKLDFVNSLKEKYGIYEMTQLHPNDRDLLLRKTYQIKFTHIGKVEDIIKEIANNPFIEYAEKKELHEKFLTPNDLGANTTTGTGMWHLHKINAQQAWDLSTGSASVVVAVTDDAILSTHQDLVNKLVSGYDAPTGGTNTNPCGSNNGNHGTHVSGTVGAQTNNNIGVASIGYNVSVMPVKIGNCSGSLTHGYEGLNWAANNGADVINMSWGGGGQSTYGQNVCNAAFNAGAILVAAAGNDGTTQRFYPAAYNNVIAVASTTNTDAKSGFSQYGTWVTISAPGSAIRSTYATSNTAYNRIQGTSMASPNVAGLLGLMKSYVPTASNQDIINCLLSSATNINAANPNFVGQLGSGRIDAYQALLCVGAFNVANDAGIIDINSPAPTVCGATFTPIVTLRNFGGNPLTSVTINYTFNGNSLNFPWTGNLTSGQSVQVTLPQQTAVAGAYTFTATTVNPNGQADQNNANNSSSVNFSLDPNGQTVSLTLITDCYGTEITWNIKDANNATVATGGPYTNVAGGQTNNASLCLNTGCYTFNILDSYGDGLYGSQWQSCSVNGNYYMRNSVGDTLFKMTAVNGNFGSGTSHSFCIIPSNILNDAGISEIVFPKGIVCDGSIVPVVQIRNFGSNPLTSAQITYNTGGSPQTFNWTGNLASGLSANVTLPAISVGTGAVTFTASTLLPNNTSDDNNLNNQSQQDFIVYGNGLSLPFTETFENNPFNNGTWTILNPDNEITWEIATITGTTPGNKAAKMNFFQYAQSSRRDGMISPKINLSGYTSVEMTFQHAYRRFNQTTSDSLIIYVSTDCGLNYTRIFARGENGSGTFATAATSSAAFSPANTNEWCMGTVGTNCYSVNLSQFIGQQVLIMFEGFNSGTIGNNLYIDNINITGVFNPNMPTAAFTSNNTTICEGEQVSFTNQSSTNSTSWNWSFPGGNPSSSNLQNPTVVYPAAGTYTVSLEAINNAGNNTVSTTNYITVNSSGTLNATAVPSIICEGSNSSISVVGGSSYSWTPSNGLTTATGAQIVASPSSTTTYTVSGQGNCGTINTSVTVTVNASPVTPPITQVGNVLSVTIPSNHSIQWYLNGNPIIGASNATITITQNGDYSYMLTDNNGCFSISEIYDAKLDNTGLEENFIGFNYSIFPNPSSGIVNITLTNVSEQISLRIFDILSKEINLTDNSSSINQSNNFQIDLSAYSSGVYFINLRTNKGTVVEKIMIQK
jgi:PKD repeat protein